MNKLAAVLIFLAVFLLPAMAFAQDAEDVEILDDDPISIFINEIFQVLMDENMDALIDLYHPDSESIPNDEDVLAFETAFADLNFFALVHSIKFIAEVDDLTLVEVEYVGVLYEEDDPPEFNVADDDLLFVQFELKKLDDDWKIWKRTDL